MKLETLNFFAGNLLEPLFLVFEVLDDSDHAAHVPLMRDLQRINASDLAAYEQEHRLDFHVERFQNKDLGKRAYFLVDLLHKTIAEERLKALTANKDRPQPYDNHVFDDVQLHKNQLVSMAGVRPWFGGFTHHDRCFTLCPATSGSNSSCWTFNAFMDLLQDKPMEQFKVRLDPFIDLPKDAFNPMSYKMTVYGLPLNWDRMKTLKSEEFGQWMSDSSRTDYLFTDYVWKPADGELHFTCEELPKADAVSYRGSRYFHAIFEMETGMVKHCDGAIRIYDEHEIAYRANFHVRNAEVRKTGVRVKIFQIDTPISKEEFSLMLGSFFVWNDDVQNYIATGFQEQSGS